MSQPAAAAPRRCVRDAASAAIHSAIDIHSSVHLAIHLSPRRPPRRAPISDSRAQHGGQRTGWPPAGPPARRRIHSYPISTWSGCDRLHFSTPVKTRGLCSIWLIILVSETTRDSARYTICSFCAANTRKISPQKSIFKHRPISSSAHAPQTYVAIMINQC